MIIVIYKTLILQILIMNILIILIYSRANYQKGVNDVYMRSPTIIYEIYKKILEDIGYNTNDTCDITFYDMSAF